MIHYLMYLMFFKHYLMYLMFFHHSQKHHIASYKKAKKKTQQIPHRLIITHLFQNDLCLLSLILVATVSLIGAFAFGKNHILYTYILYYIILPQWFKQVYKIYIIFSWVLFFRVSYCKHDTINLKVWIVSTVATMIQLLWLLN